MLGFTDNNSQRVTHVINLLKKYNSKIVLEVGSASGPAAYQFALAGYRVTALDIRDYGYKSDKYRHPNIEFITADATTVNLIETYDAAHFG